jgi:peptidoglycan/LPS O-acetylase OafA/YrhL
MNNTMPLPKFDQSKSIYLEFYRGTAALGVAICHFVAAGGVMFSEFLAVVFVEMFFPLSGFILAPQVIRIYKDRRSFPIFLLRRWIRTIPLYMLGLVAIAAMTFNFGTPEFSRYLFFYHFLQENYTHNNFYPISWSLAVEEYYYVFFPLFCFLIPRTTLLTKTILFIGLGVSIKLWMMLDAPQSYIRIATYSRIDAIAIGFLCFQIMDYIKTKHLTLPLVIFVAAATGHYYFHSPGLLVLFVYSANIFFGMTCALLYHREKSRPCENRLFRGFATMIGATSYSVYVFHIIVLGIAVKTGITLIPYIGIVLLLARALHIYFELPLMNLRPKYRPLLD